MDRDTRRLTLFFFGVVGTLLAFVAVASKDVVFPWIFQRTQAIWWGFLPPLVGSLIGVFAANWLEQKRTQNEKARERDVLLKNIRAEIEANMVNTMNLQDPNQRLFIRRGDLAASEKVQTEAWDSCIYSGQAALLGFEQRGKIALVYRLLHDYNEIDWENEYGNRQDGMLNNIREQMQRLWNESFWPKDT